MLADFARKHDIRRVGKFGAVGVINTLLDFFLFNLLTKFFMLPVVPANTASTTVSMVFSFLANRSVVFKGRDGSAARQAIAFYLVTAVGLYVVQNGIIYLLVHVWTAPLLAAVQVVRSMGISQLSDGFYINNGAKAVGTVASLSWNYLLYKRLVFK